MAYENEIPATPDELSQARAEGHEFTKRSIYDGYGWACTTCGCYVGPSDGCRCDREEDEFRDDDRAAS
jgi:hypothetical protein